MCETLQLNWKLTNQPSPDGNNNLKKKSAKYALRGGSIKKRVDVDQKTTQPKKRGPKPRPKTAPMSKYRRKTANLRERQRMGDINTAFENLREKIPSLAVAKAKEGARCEKMTKINILHVAISYIRALENILDTGDAGVNEYGTAVVQSPFLPLPKGFEEDSKTKTPTKTKTNKLKTKEALCRGFRKERNVSTSSCSNSSSGDSGIMEEEEEGEDDKEEDCPDWTELISTLEFPPVKDNMDLTLSSLIPTSPIKDIPMDWKSKGILQQKNCSSNPLFLMPDLGGEDIFSDLNSSLESIDGISFVHEDPFQMII